MFGDFADVQQTIGPRNDFDERAELGDTHHFAQIRFADFGNGRQIVDHLNSFLRGRAVVGGDIDFAGIVHVNLHAGLLDNAADHLATRSDQVADLVHRDLQGVNARSEGGDVVAAAGEDSFHLVQDVQTTVPRLFHRLTHDL